MEQFPLCYRIQAVGGIFSHYNRRDKTMNDLETTLRAFSALQTIALVVFFFAGMLIVTVSLSENNLKWFVLAIVMVASPILFALFQFA